MMRHISEIVDEIMQRWNREWWVLRLDHHTGQIEVTRGGAFDEVRGKTMIRTARFRDDAYKMQALLTSWRKARTCAESERVRGEMLAFFDNVAACIRAKIESDIHERGLNDFNACDRDAMKSWNSSREADALISEFIETENISRKVAA